MNALISTHPYLISLPPYPFYGQPLDRVWIRLIEKESETYPVDDPRRVDVLHAPEDLVDEKLDVVVRESLSLNDGVEVGAHQGSHQVQIGERVDRRRRREHVQQTNYLKHY